MGECINLRRGGKAKKLPVLNPNFPADFSCMTNNGTHTFNVEFAEHGYPADYTYKWYWDGSLLDWATKETCTVSLAHGASTHTIYCEVTNKAGTVRSRTATLTLTQAYLFNWGDHCDAVTGGWQVTKTLDASATAYSVGTLKYNSSDQITMDLAWRNDGFLAPRNKIDLTHYSKVRCYVYLYSDDADYPWYFSVATHNNPAGNYVVANIELPYPNGSQYEGWREVELDISNLTGSYYVGIRSWIYDDHAYCSIGYMELVP